MDIKSEHFWNWLNKEKFKKVSDYNPIHLYIEDVIPNKKEEIEIENNHNDGNHNEIDFTIFRL